MSKYLKTILFFLLIMIVLMGCNKNSNNYNGPSNQTNGQSKNDVVENDTEETEVEDGASNVEQIIAEAAKVNNEFESYSTVEERDTVEMFNGEKNHLFAKEEAKVIFSPFQFALKIEQEQLDDSDYLDKEFYAQQGGIYTVDDISYILLEGEQWNKSKVGYTEAEMQDQERIHLDKKVQQYRSVSLDETFEETDRHYVLTFEFDLDKVAENDIEAEQNEYHISKEGYKVDAMDMAIKINKETLYLETITTNKTFSYEQEFNEEKGEMSVSYENILTYQDQNEVKEIVVPDEVLETAEEF